LEYLRAHLNILGFDKIKSRFDRSKNRGFSFEDLISKLLILMLTGIDSIHGLVTYKDKELSRSGKDSYYTILTNQKIEWSDLEKRA
jgi:hypothetical protein